MLGGYGARGRGDVEAKKILDDARAIAEAGAFVIVLEGVTLQPLGEDELRTRVRTMRASGLSARDVAAALVREDGAPRNLAYRLAHEA